MENIIGRQKRRDKGKKEKKGIWEHETIVSERAGRSRKFSRSIICVYRQIFVKEKDGAQKPESWRVRETKVVT